MGAEWTSPFTAWANFYVIVGSAAAALTALQFVVIVLGAELSVNASEHGTSAFGTPTIVHFSAALLNAAILSAPWRRLASAAAAIGVFACGSVIYLLLVVRRSRRQTDYVPVLEDWIWHFVLPLVCYAALLVAAMVLPAHPAPVLFVVGAASLLLLFIGIHNAWDSVVYIATRRRRANDADKGRSAEP